jgi:hypothetical protein
MRSLEIKAGDPYGRLRIVKEAPRTGKKGYVRAFECICECGNTVVVRLSNLRHGDGNTTSCGCYHAERQSEASRTHGETGTVEWKIWCGLRRRCNPDYGPYAGRITVCDRWAKYENFLADMGRRPSRKHTIERKDNDGPYSPDNCVWETRIVQNNNKRNNVKLTIDGVTLSVSQWAKERGVRPERIFNRLSSGWDEREAVFGESRRRPRCQKT